MALIDNDQIKEIRAEKLTVMRKHFFVGFFFAVRFVANQLLIERKEDLIWSDSRFVVFYKIDFVHDFFQWFKVAADRLVD